VNVLLAANTIAATAIAITTVQDAASDLAPGTEVRILPTGQVLKL
jgi:hypothetical protein